MVNETFIIEGKTIVAGKVFKFTSVLPLPLPLTFYFYLKKNDEIRKHRLLFIIIEAKIIVAGKA
jgi:hypothetical protein